MKNCWQCSNFHKGRNKKPCSDCVKYSHFRLWILDQIEGDERNKGKE